MAHVTRISAGKSSPKKDPATKTSTKPKTTPKKVTKTNPKTVAKAPAKTTKKLPPVLQVITAPFRALGRYLSDSWQEIRQVRWPSRKATWKLVLAVFVYTAIFMAFIMLLDAFFTFTFNQILAN